MKRIARNELPSLRRDPVDAETLAGAANIVSAVREGGDRSLREYAERFGDLEAGAPMVISREACEAALESLPMADQELLRRTAGRIRAFAEAQRAAISETEVPIPGGVAGHDVSPMKVAGCYAPGGRFPLPSSVLMTAVTARAAGVETVWVASPKPTAVTLAAAAVAGADALLAVGGAQAISAMAYGTESVPGCDVIVGPGNRWVTAAKQLVSGVVAIDMLAGPSELLVLADDSADAVTVAADLLAQAEHDPDAVPILVTTSERLADEVDAEIQRQVALLKTKETASAALQNGFTVLAANLDEAIEAADQLAPEHLEVMTEDSESVARRLQHYGGLFIGEGAAEVLGDYGAGPNHVLPTGGTARYTGGLSVMTFLRVRTWMRIDDRAAAQGLAADAAALAQHEGLHAHELSARRRLD